MNISILIVNIFVGYFIAWFFAGSKKGEQREFKSLKFPIRNYKIHLHHWFISSIFLITLLILNFYNDIIYGLLIGLIIQGLTYKDFYKIIKRKGKKA